MKDLEKINEAIAISRDNVAKAKLAYKEKKDLLDALEASMDPIETQDEQEEKQD